MKIGHLFRASWADLRASRRQDTAYKRMWSAFTGFSAVADGRHDTPAWRSHGGPFAVCVIAVPAEALQPSLDELRSAIGEMPFVRIHPDHFLHLTLQELGFVCPRPSRTDEISPERLDEFVASATAAVAEAAAFDLRLGGANSFQDAVFLDVHDRGRCAKLHARLRELAAVTTVPRFAYLPHTTIAHFTDEAPAGELAQTIGQWRDRRFGTFRVAELSVVTLDVDEAYPALHRHATIPLLA